MDKAVWDFLERLSMPGALEKKLEAMSDWTAERSHGNYDDCFEDGKAQADACIALTARALLKKFSPIETKREDEK